MGGSGPSPVAGSPQRPRLSLRRWKGRRAGGAFSKSKERFLLCFHLLRLRLYNGAGAGLDASVTPLLAAFLTPIAARDWRRPWIRGAGRLARGGVLEQYREHGKQAQRRRRGLAPPRSRWWSEKRLDAPAGGTIALQRPLGTPTDCFARFSRLHIGACFLVKYLHAGGLTERCLLEKSSRRKRAIVS